VLAGLTIVRDRQTDQARPTPFVTINRIYTRATVMRPNKTVGYKMQNTNYKIRYTEMSKIPGLNDSNFIIKHYDIKQTTRATYTCRPYM